MTKANESAVLFGILSALFGCNVEPTQNSTGGVEAERKGVCPAGLAVVLTDFLSTQVALSDLSGVTLSAAFLSTASTQVSGVSFALSGDVVLPSSPPRSKRLVLLDRFGTNVITWADPKTADVLAQLPVGTGFESNPQDYLEVDDARAYVTRWGHNGSPGAEPFDAGDDVLIVDTRGPSIIGRIALPGEGELPPRPSGMIALEAAVAVVLQRLALDFSRTGDGALVGISTESDSVVWEHRFTGLKACGTPELSPDRTKLAVSCTGSIDESGEIRNLDESAIVLLDATAQPPSELRRYHSQDLAGEATQGAIEFANDGVLLFKTQTALGGATNNRLLALELESGAVTPLLEARPDEGGSGQGVAYGAVFCGVGCGGVCLMADADRGLLQRFSATPEALTPLDPVAVETSVGLPPRDLGGF